MDSQANRYSIYFQKLGLRAIADVEESLRRNKDLILRFVDTWLKRKDRQPGGTFLPGVSLFYLMYVLLASTTDSELIEEYLREAFPSTARSDPEPMRLELQRFYEAAQRDD
jgi:hypothetical protein